ncbi:hypothetical protein D3C80_2143970 [compost metagenome]
MTKHRADRNFLIRTQRAEKTHVDGVARKAFILELSGDSIFLKKLQSRIQASPW